MSSALLVLGCVVFVWLLVVSLMRMAAVPPAEVGGAHPADGYQFTVVATAHEAEAAGGISSVAVNVTAPVIGAVPDSAGAALDEIAYFTIASVTWSPPAAAFRDSERYTAKVTLEANDGYGFGTDVTAEINGQAATVRSNNGATLSIMYTFPKLTEEDVVGVIANAAVNITAPESGRTPDPAAGVSEGQVGFTAGSVTWAPDIEEFRAGFRYIALVTLTANEGNTFSAHARATVNGESATIRENTGETLTLMHTFPAAG